MEIKENIPYVLAGSPEQTLELYLPDSDTFPVLIYFHGGGLERGEELLINKPRYLLYLQSKGVAVIRAEYRSYPDACYPDFIHDAASAVAWALKHMPEYGNVTGYFVGGSSAGGYLTQMLCFDKKYLGKHKIDPDSIDGYLMDAGQPTAHFNVLKERGIDSRRVIIDESAPLYHVCAERNYPPMQITVAEHDVACRYEQTQLLIATLKNLGHPEEKIDYHFMPGYKHVGYSKAKDENGDSVLGKLFYDFIMKYQKKETS